VDTVPFQVGQAVNVGSEIAIVIDPDPMLAVGQVSEARRGTLEVGQTADVRFIDGSTAVGEIDFVGLSAEKATRTYPVEARMKNADSAIGDGVTCEMSVKLAPVQATAVPRSALIFSDAGELGLRIVVDDIAHFQPVKVVEDGRELVWVSGFTAPVDVIVVGQDFVKEGDRVESRPATDAMGGQPAASAGPPA
jgi:membrane fusion protein, multidrug efflux system